MDRKNGRGWPGHALVRVRLYTKKLPGNPKQSHQRRAGKAANARKNVLKTRGGVVVAGVGGGRRRWRGGGGGRRAAVAVLGGILEGVREQRKETGRGFQWKGSEGRWRTLK